MTGKHNVFLHTIRKIRSVKVARSWKLHDLRAASTSRVSIGGTQIDQSASHIETRKRFGLKCGRPCPSAPKRKQSSNGTRENRKYKLARHKRNIYDVPPDEVEHFDAIIQIPRQKLEIPVQPAMLYRRRRSWQCQTQAVEDQKKGANGDSL